MFSHVMIGEDLHFIRDEKPGAKNIEMNLLTAAVDGQERIVKLIFYRFASVGHTGVVQCQSRDAIAETDDNMNKAHTGFVGLDNRLRDLAFSLKPLQALFYRA